MKKVFFVISILWIAFAGCSEEEMENSMVIEFGTTCGWCAGQEFIVIKDSKVEYTRTIPCGDNKGTTRKNKNLSKTEWNSIQNAFNYQLFLSLQHDECNVCVDGCDEQLKITKDGNEHLLSYSPSTEIEGMDNLLEKLNELMNELRD